MAEEANAPASAWDRFKSEGGWLALIISALVGQATITGLLTAAVDPPSLDIEGARLFWQVFLVTTPLTVAGVIFFGLVFAGVLNNGYHVVMAGAASLGLGLFIGTALGSTGGIDLDAAFAATAGNSGPAGATKTIWWYLSAYYQLYGIGYFASSILLGGFFGKWAAWLIKEA
jgi:hypothetical protein